jgi:hypothetical protein
MPLPTEEPKALMTKRECPTPGAPDLPDESQNCAARVNTSLVIVISGSYTCMWFSASSRRMIIVAG